MSSQPSASDPNPFLLLDPGIQRWIWDRQWTSLRTVQERAIPALLHGAQDVILAAATSAGKTEAAFFPLLTRLLQPQAEHSLVLSISPLKALINDQQDRLQDLCEQLGLPVLGWHGDVSQSRKQRFMRESRGILIMTPESLEALFVNKGTSIAAFAAHIEALVVDELHSLIGTERGKQVQSQMSRLERAAGRRIPRVGLSATLGDMQLAAEFLRPDAGQAVEIIDTAGEAWSLQLIVKAFVDDPAIVGLSAASKADLKATESPADDDAEPEEDPSGSARFAIANYLFEHLRGSNNLIFPNSRSKAEYYADRLRRLCNATGIPNEFWVHHGSLSRDFREETEKALKNGAVAATAVCTTTLELGIDIGNIRSVAQIGPPPSVASLRQRLGRSGRRPGESAMLRCMTIESKLDKNSQFSDRIRETTLQTAAMLRLLMQRWVEPPRTAVLHASTLVQQILSILAERGGATAADLWASLVRSGTFSAITRDDFLALLKHLGEREILQQDESGLLLPGTLGEKLVNRYDFYAAFVSNEEFRLIADGRSLGSLPVSRPLTKGQRVIFGGRRWRVLDVDTERKVIAATADRGGAPPAFDGNGGRVHDRVRMEMQTLLKESGPIGFLDKNAQRLIDEARTFFASSPARSKPWFIEGKIILVPTWRGDWINDALALLLTANGVETSNEGVALSVHSTDQARLLTAFQSIAGYQPVTPVHLRMRPLDTQVQKWDWALPQSLCLASFASAELDLAGAQQVAAALLQRHSAQQD